MLKISAQSPSVFFLLTLLSGMIAASGVVTAQTPANKLGTYDEATRIFTCTDGNFQINFPEPPKTGISKSSLNKEPAFAGYDFGDEKLIDMTLGGLFVMYTESEKLETTDRKEKRRLADAALEAVTGIDFSKQASTKRREVEVSGASFAVEYSAVIDNSSGENEEGEAREIRMRVVFAEQTLYIILLVAEPDAFKIEEIAKLTDSFKLLSVPGNDASDGHPSSNDSAPEPAKDSNAPGPALTKFTFAKDGFRMSFPVKPKESKSESQTESGNAFVQNRYTVETMAGAYMVSVQDSTLDPIANAEVVKLTFDNTSLGLAKSFSGEVLKQNDLVIRQGVTSREIRVSMSQPPGIYRTRLFFANARFYQLIAAGTAEFANGSEAEEFFNSFQLLNRDSKPSPESTLIDYSSVLGGFNARVPFKPVYSRRTQTDAGGQDRIQHLYMCDEEESGSGALLISVTEFNGLCQNSDSQLHTMCESFVRGMAGKNTVEQFARVPSDANPYEWAFQHTTSETGVKVQGRVLIANDRFFVVQAIGGAEYLSDSTTIEAVQSLAVITEASKE